MKRLTDVRLAIFLPLFLLAGCNKAPQADIAFYGDNIITLSEQSESANFVAVKDDTIVFVGQRDDWDGQTTEVVNLEDSALLPGFIDAHGHVAWHGKLSGYGQHSFASRWASRGYERIGLGIEKPYSLKRTS